MQGHSLQGLDRPGTAISIGLSPQRVTVEGHVPRVAKRVTLLQMCNTVMLWDNALWRVSNH